MKRSIIKHGPATLIVSIPAKWAKERNLKAGSEVDVTPQGSSLIIRTEEELSTHEHSFDVTLLPSFMITRLLARTYQKGCDVIKLRFKDDLCRETIREKVEELLGFEIIEEDSETCTVQAISQNLAIDFDSALRRAFYRVLENTRTLRDSYKSSDKELLNQIWSRDREVNKLTSYCLRTLAKGKIAGHDVLVLYHLIDSLEDTGDEIKKTARLLAKSSRRNPTIQKKLAVLVELTEATIRFFYSPKHVDAVRGFALAKELSDLKHVKVTKESMQVQVQLGKCSEFLLQFFAMRLDTLKEIRTEKIKPDAKTA